VPAGTSCPATAPTAPAAIAYFSPEYGITAALPQYSGGLGILAGDHLKSASDLGVPLIGVGLLYRHGYFTQSLSAEGWQAERYPASDPAGLPIALLRDAARAPGKITVGLPGGELAAHICRRCGPDPLLLLDSHRGQRSALIREVTDRLPARGSDHRLRRELLLGIGGVRAVRLYCAIAVTRSPAGLPHQRGSCPFLSVGGSGVPKWPPSPRQSSGQGGPYSTRTPVPGSTGSTRS
jgi:starch phosphorylase